MRAFSYQLQRWWIALKAASQQPAPWLLGSSFVLIVWGGALLSMHDPYQLSAYSQLLVLPVPAQGLAALALGALGVAVAPRVPGIIFEGVSGLIMVMWLWIATAFVVEVGVSTALTYFALAAFNLWSVYLARFHRHTTTSVDV